MDEAAIGRVRSFNRTVSQRIGALDEGFLGRGRPLGQSRVLWEIGPDGCDLRQLRGRLDLDSGYLSRLLHSLVSDGLISVGPSKADGRVRTARLTAAGRSERAELDRRSDDAARAILRPLSGGQRARLVAAMTEVDRLLTASMVSITACDPADPPARSCVQAYFAELARRFEQGFDPGLSISAEDAEVTPPSGAFLIAILHGQPVGCGAVKFHRDAPAEIKRMWTDPCARGLGLGRRMLAELEARAVSAGARLIRLETNRALTEAVTMYRSAGYREVPAFSAEPYAHHWFEKAVSATVTGG
jgi:DNA-binding MarR family transcriptional regulator/GNAT superfamily N-acetyltransferase